MKSAILAKIDVLSWEVHQGEKQGEWGFGEQYNQTNHLEDNSSIC